MNSLQDMILVAIGDMVGLQILHKHLIARDRKKAAKFREIENAIVTYVTQHCSCYNDIDTILP